MRESIVNIYDKLILGRPLVTLIVVLSLLVGLAAGLPRFKLDASADSLTLEHDTDLDYFREISSRYQSGDFLVITYKPHAPLFSDEALNTLQALRDELLQLHGVVGANTILDVPLLYSPLQTLDEVLESERTLLTPGVDREMAKREFQESPIYRKLILGPDGDTTAIQLNLEVDNKYTELVRHRDSLRKKRDTEGLTDAESQELADVSKTFLDYRTQKDAEAHERVAQVREIVARYQDRADIFIGGVTMITADMIQFIKSDMVVFGAIAAAFILLMMAIIFRQLRFVLIPFCTCVITVTMMLGYLSWLDWRMTVISNNFVALLLILTLAITIHLVVRYRELHAKHPDWSQRALVLQTVRFMVVPCLYTTLTTIVAFVSLVVSDIKPVIDFGWMMTIGLMVAFAMAFIFLPSTLLLLPKGEPKDKGDNSGAITMIFSRFTEKHGNAVVIFSVLIAATTIYGMSRLVVENRPIDYFHESTEIYQGMVVIDRNFGGTTSLDIILDVPVRSAEDESAIGEDPFAEDDPFAVEDAGFEDDPFAEEDPFAESDPFGEDDPFAENEESKKELKESYWFSNAGLSEIEQLHDYLDSLPEVGKVQSLAIAYKVVRDIYRGPLNDFELAVLQNELPDNVKALLVDPFLSYEANQTRITLRVEETSGNLRRVELIEKIRAYAENEMGLQSEQVKFTGLLKLYNNMLQSLFTSQIATLGAVFLGIMLMFLVLFRSFTLALSAIIPNILAAGAVLGFMGLVGIPLDMMNITMAAITVGIGIDDAIHYIHRFKTEFAVDRNYLNAMHRSHGSIGRAMYYTSVTITAGFSVLVLSEFIPSVYFGLLTSIAMIAAIVGSLTLLPKLILILKPLGPEEPAA
ncbi:RND family transporter [Aurantivibrio plasticivorans]